MGGYTGVLSEKSIKILEEEFHNLETPLMIRQNEKVSHQFDAGIFLEFLEETITPRMLHVGMSQ